jgi:hypothetical protein
MFEVDLDLDGFRGRQTVNPLAVDLLYVSVRPSFLRTTPAKKPRTECCCQPVAFTIAAIVAPSLVVLAPHRNGAAVARIASFCFCAILCPSKHRGSKYD